MKNVLPLALAAMAVFGSVTNAKTFYLKKAVNSKKKIVGEEVSREKGVVEIKEVLPSGIINFFSVKVSNIKNVTLEDKVAERYAAVLELKNTPDLQELDWYKEQHQKLITSFYKDFPTASEVTEVKKIEEALLAEIKVIKEGGLKVGGVIISAKERQASAYDIDSQIEAKKYRDFVKKGDIGAAIGVADKMELDFSKSKAYGSLVKDLPVMTQRYKRVLMAMEKKRVRDEQNLANYKKDSGEEAYNKVVVERKKTYDRAERRIKMAKDDGKVWLPVNPQSKASIAGQMAMLDKYMSGVQAKAEAYQDFDGGAIFTKGWNLVEEQKFDEAKEEIKKLEALEFNLGYLSTLEEFCNEEEDRKNDAEMASIRGNGEGDVIDLYINIDYKIQDTLFEATDYVSTVTDEASAKLTRSKLRVFMSRLARMEKMRSELEKMEPQDMETQNAEFAQAIEPLIANYIEAHDKTIMAGKHLGSLKEPMMDFKDALPNPDDYLTENAKAKILKMKEEMLAQALAKLGMSTPKLPKGYQGKIAVVYTNGDKEVGFLAEALKEGEWKDFKVKAEDEVLKVLHGEVELGEVKPEGSYELLLDAERFIDVNGELESLIGHITMGEKKVPLRVKLVK